MRMSTIDPVAVSAAVIALCALFATIWQAWLTRTHNRLSVRPHLICHRIRNETDSGLEIALVIRNVGVGPAFIADRYFTVAGNRWLSDSSDQIPPLLEHIIGRKIEYKLAQHGLPGVSTAIPPGDAHELVRIFLPITAVQAEKAIDDSVKNAAFHIQYKSLYGDVHALDVS